MARSKWTLMLVPHDNDRVRSVQVSSSSVRILLSLILLASLLFGTVSIGFFIKQSHRFRAERLERENLLLAAEVDEMRDQMENLSASIDVLSEKGEKYRRMAGLPAAPQQTERPRSRGGIGGSMLASLASNQFNQVVRQKISTTSTDLEALIGRADLLRSSMDQAITTLQSNTERLESTPSISPSDGLLTSVFSRNRRHPVLRITRPHKGIDIAAPVGEPILAPAKGRVAFAGVRSGGYGNTVEIRHGFGYVTRFAHTSRILVRAGDIVERGQIIAEVGATGLVSAPHLHYEVEVSGKPVDPMNFIIADAIPD